MSPGLLLFILAFACLALLGAAVVVDWMTKTRISPENGRQTNQNTYLKHVTCNNCDIFTDLEIPKGIPFDKYYSEHKKQMKCPICDVTGKIDNSYSSPSINPKHLVEIVGNEPEGEPC